MNNTMIFIDEFAYRSPFANCHAMLKFIFTAVVLILCLLFRDIAVSIYIFVTMFLCNVFKNHVKWNDYVKLLTIPFLFIFFACILFSIDILPRLQQRGIVQKSIAECSSYVIAMILFIFSIIDLSASTFNPFIYFQF